MRQAGGLIAVVLGIASATAQAAAPAPATDAWLQGEWVPCRDPDQDSKERFRFEGGGNGWIVSPVADIELVYSVRDDRVEMLGNRNGRPFPITLTFTDARDELVFHNPRTGNDSTYVRKDGPRVGECTQ